MVGEEGSKILVTTRSIEVASIMVDKFPPYPLGILKENDCWSLFKEIAFGSAAGAVETPELVKIGKEMVGRCGGLPLAVIFLGSLMRSKKKEEEWKNIRDTKIWHESKEGGKSEDVILPSLRLSYVHLPSYLKHCFSYCCIFPKDFIIDKKTLIRLWMAEGFLIESPGDNAMSMEEIGSEYFHILLSNFFFQDAKRNEGDIVTCKMHDLVHDLARSVVGKNECLIVENAHDIDCISEATIRLNLVNVDEGMLPKVLEALENAKNLRTVFVDYKKTWIDIGKAFKKNKRLRVLDLRGFNFGFNFGGAVPSSIGELKHLRYLHLPEEFFVPKGIGRLRFLQTLNVFDLGYDSDKKKNAGGIEDLKGLNLLRGDLTINRLQKVTTAAACRANLNEKKKLHGLKLTWENSYIAAGNNVYLSANDYETALEGLRPHHNLRTLEINNFQGAKFPRWIEDSSCLSNLVELTLYDCNYIEKLECIGTGSESSSSRTTSVAFPSLKKLYLQHMNSLKEWVVPVPVPPQASTTTCFPLLEEIKINYCRQLSTITPTTTIFPSLRVLNLNSLTIDGRAVETLVTNNLNSLTSLRLDWIPNLITLPRQGLIENNNTLLSLRIEYCRRFEGFLPLNMDDDDDEDQEGGGQQQLQQVVSSSSSCSSSSSSSLQSLTLYECPALRFYPNILRSLTSLRSLVIQECKESKSLQDDLTCLSSSSSSLEHLEHLQILNNKTATTEVLPPEVVFEWRKSSTFKK